ncbi:uncharacterized protein LOC134188488 [Corticium candelabrum]|uniref:uncharacterized protein LOC134188488 n=1 Tax=Corticium candelabrum TaxID=121492 RepID=UPI002E273F70|nr:uncharacterized protein LOC134188488 [Corticium candelabrum]
MPLSLEERFFLVKEVYSHGGKYSKEVQNIFKENFGEEQLPDRHCVDALMKKFEQTGSMQDRPRSGRPSVINNEALRDVTKKLDRSPHKSLRRLSQEVGMSLTSTYRAVKKQKFFPYKVSAVHELKAQDTEKRVSFCRWFQQFIDMNGENILNDTFFTDDAWFHLSGYTNRQNSRSWATENPHEIFEKPLHDQKIGVSCAVSRSRIIGPIFFDSTVNSDRYIKNIFVPFSEQLTASEKQRTWFQQDGATTHTARATMTAVRKVFGERVISQDLWPPRSPDLTPPDFYLWGKLKDLVYADNPRSINDLKHNIRQIICRYQM